jgi:hypothetical protein
MMTEEEEEEETTREGGTKLCRDVVGCMSCAFAER